MPAPHTPSFQPVEIFGQTERCAACRGFNDVSGLAPLVDYSCVNCGAQQRAMRHYRNFEIEGLLGYGGMSSVYRARDVILHRVVALKLLLGEVTKDAQLRAALQKEAMMTASVTHANVVKIYDAGSEGETCYVAMELLEGGTLSDLIERGGAIPELRVLEFGIQVAEGLNASWKKGLLHRDIKPGNVLFQDERTAKVSDFGLAVTAEEARHSQTPLWGTPVYISPERSAQQKEDVRSDIYSVGATLFHALAGRVPFEGQSLDEVESARSRGKAPSVQEFAPKVSDETAALLARTLEKKREDRTQTYGELIEGLEQCRRILQSRMKGRSISGGRSATRTAASPSVSGDGRATSAGRAADAQAKPQNGRSSGTRWVWVVVAMIVLTTCAYGWKAGWLEEMPLSRNDSARFDLLIAEARAAALRGDFVGAARSFLAISQDRNAPIAAKDWSNLQAGNAYLLANDLPKARAAFLRFDPRIDRSRDSTLEFLAQVARQCAAMEPVPKAMAAGIRPDSHQAVGLLAYGLLDWDLGSFDSAAVFLRQFSTCNPPGELWIDNYKPLITPYLTELEKLEDLHGFDRSGPKDVQQKQLQRLSEQVSEFRPNSPLLAAYKEKLTELGFHPAEGAKPDRKPQMPPDGSKYSSTSPSVYGAPASIGFAFAQTVKINRWVIPSFLGDNGDAPVMVQLQASEDGISWRQIDQQPYKRSEQIDRKTAEFSAHYVKVSIQEPTAAGDPKTRISRCELYGPDGPISKLPPLDSNLALHKQALGDNSNSGAQDSPGTAFDGIPRSAWVHRGQPASLGVDLEKPTKISRWIVMHSGATDPGFGSRLSAHNTVDFALQASDDGREWRDIDKVLGNQSDVTDRQTPEFTARYVRIYITSLNTSGDPRARIGEFELYGPEK